jgi:hypothetical protein
MQRDFSFVYRNNENMIHYLSTIKGDSVYLSLFLSLSLSLSFFHSLYYDS